MSYTQDDLTRLEQAMAKGASQVRVGDEQITFRSLTEMRQLRAEMQRALAGSAAPSATTYPQFVRRPTA